jgi:FtsH-binding integral membrane protein
MAQYETLRSGVAGARSAAIDIGLRAHMNKVYGLMSVGMVLTGAAAWGFGSSPALLSILRDPSTLQPNILGWVVRFAPLAMVFLLSSSVNRLSVGAGQLMFYAFSAVMGMSMSWIFAVYTGVSIAQTFLITAIAFAGLSLYSYTTKRDLSRMVV